MVLLSYMCVYVCVVQSHRDTITAETISPIRRPLLNISQNVLQILLYIEIM